MPLYLGDAHVVLTPLGDGLRLGSTLELAGWDMRVRPRRVAVLREAGERVMGMPADGPVRQIWRGPRPVTPDGLPVIGRVPRRERVIVAAGHCMLGLSLGPVTGRLVAQVAGGAGRRSTWRRSARSASLMRRPAQRRRPPPVSDRCRHVTLTKIGLQ